MGFVIGTTVLASLGVLGVLALAVTLALPLAWLWMLIDALVREEWEYPGGTATSQNRLLWVLLILFVHVAAVPYFFMVYRAVPRGAVRPPAPAAA